MRWCASAQAEQALDPPLVAALDLDALLVTSEGAGGLLLEVALAVRLALRILPVPVTLKRLAAPRWVFIFGMSRSSALG